MRKHRKTLSFLMTMLMIWTLTCSVSAAETQDKVVPDLTKKGTIRVTVREADSKKQVPGGKMTIYQVAQAKEDDGDYMFRYAEDFAACELPLENLDDPKLAGAYTEYVQGNQLEGMSIEVDGEGVATFENLDCGLYLIIQTEAASQYSAMNPFLVTIPMLEEGEYIYNIDATPKTGPVKKPEKPDKPGKPKPPGKLPQTGQLWWPVPVLAVLGMLCLLIGFNKRRTIE